MSWMSFGLGAGAGVLVVLLLVGIVLLVISFPARLTRGSNADPASALQPGETRLDDVAVSSCVVLTAGGPLRDITATGSRITLSSSGLRAGQLDIVATLPFDTAAQQLGEGFELYASGDLAGLRRTIGMLGREIHIRATGRVRAHRGRLVIEPETVELGSSAWLDEIASTTVRSLVTIRHTVAGLPAGMRLDVVDVRPDGFRVELSGSGVEIGRQPPGG